MAEIEIVGRLHGFTSRGLPDVGSVIGYHHKAQRFLSVAQITQGEVLLRWSTPEELTRIATREPTTVIEHQGIPNRITPFGIVKMYGPRPILKPKRVTRRRQREEDRRILHLVNSLPDVQFELKGSAEVDTLRNRVE